MAFLGGFRNRPTHPLLSGRKEHPLLSFALDSFGNKANLRQKMGGGAGSGASLGLSSESGFNISPYLKYSSGLSKLLTEGGYADLGDVIGGVGSGISAVELSKKLTGDRQYGVLYSTLKPILSAIYSGLTTTTAPVVAATTAATTTAPVVAATTAATTTAPVVAGATTATGTAAGAGAGAGAGATSAGTGTATVAGGASTLGFYAAMAAIIYAGYDTMKEGRKARHSLENALDERDDYIDGTWRAALHSMPREEARWITTNPLKNAEEMMFKGDDPDLALHLNSFFDDLINRVNKVNEWFPSFASVTAGGLPEKREDLLSSIGQLSEEGKARARMLGLEKDGALGLVDTVSPDETKSLKEWAEDLTIKWRDTSSPEDYFVFTDDGQLLDKETGKALPSVFSTKFYEAAARRPDELGGSVGMILGSSPFELQERVSGNSIVPWRLQTRASELAWETSPSGANIGAISRRAAIEDARNQVIEPTWKTNPDWKPFDDIFLYIGLPGTGQPRRFATSAGWKTPSQQEFNAFFEA